MPPEYSLNIIINTVNSIKGTVLQTRFIRITYENMELLRRNLLYHTVVRWLSKGKVLTRVMELRTELLVYLQRTKLDYSDLISDLEFLLKLACLFDPDKKYTKESFKLGKCFKS